MSAPTRTAPPPPAVAPPRPRTRSAAVQRAYARRAQRSGRLSAVAAREHAGGRARFVVLVMVLLGVALVATLWLSTAAAAGSYRLQEAQTETRDLSERAEELGRTVAALETAPELARRARALGMVPVDDPARLVTLPGGAVEVIGDPEPARAPAPPPPPAPVEPPPPVEAPAPASVEPPPPAVGG